jgi:hypothetical protein
VLFRSEEREEMRIDLVGMEDVEAQMKRVERGLVAMRNTEAFVFSSLPYAFGIHEGRHKGGKLARRAGGTFYIRRAVDEVLAQGDADLSAGLKKVTAPGAWVIRRLGLWARRRARQMAPRGGKKSGSYRLWRSIKHEVRKK